jgi:hypothetical protein
VWNVYCLSVSYAKCRWRAADTPFDSIFSNICLTFMIVLCGAYFRPAQVSWSSLDKYDFADGNNFDTCRTVVRLIAVANVVTMPAISGLFFVRLSAVYSRDKYIVAFFGSCWLAIPIFIFATTTLLSRFADRNPSLRCLSVEHPDTWGCRKSTCTKDKLIICEFLINALCDIG